MSKLVLPSTSDCGRVEATLFKDIADLIDKARKEFPESRVYITHLVPVNGEKKSTVTVESAYVDIAAQTVFCRVEKKVAGTEAVAVDFHCFHISNIALIRVAAKA